MRVSVIIPLYNKRLWVRRAIHSVLAQSFTDFELLIVDDGSTDNGALELASFNDQRLRLITQGNLGPGAARNRGSAEAQGELLAFLDADDEWLPDYLANGVKPLTQPGLEVAASSSGYFDYPSGMSRKPMWLARGIREGVCRLGSNTHPMEAVFRLAYMSPCSTIVRADIFRKYGGFYSRDRCVYGEDAFLWLKILLNEAVTFHMEPLVRFHSEASQLSKNLGGYRSLEPFLLDSTEIEDVTPTNLRGLLSKILAIRALKSACMLGYWGRWREANTLRKRFFVPGYWKLPYYIPAIICSTPFGAALGRLWRSASRVFARSELIAS